MKDLRFLIVEDHGFQRWLLESTLRSLGACDIHSAADGKAALALMHVATPPFDIAITDLDMPGMDGMELIRHVGESGAAVSLVVTSSLERSLVASVETMADAYGVALLGAFQKPITAAKLLEAIARHRDRRGRRIAATTAFSAGEVEAGLRAGQFEPFFQPKMDLRTRRITGAEALARWRHPGRGLVAAQHFVTAMEQGTAIEELTEAIVDQALAACREWRSRGLDASVSVNLSLRTAGDVSLADRLTRLARANQLEPSDVVLELTETAQAPHLGNALESLSRLRMRGFGLSIDDYGMGYSSMQQLTRIPFTELKIDRAFVRNAARRAPDRAMLESSLEMAAKLGITAVAEGVETQAEWDLLFGMGCPVAQGYFIAVPMPAAEFADWAGESTRSTAT